MLLIVILSIDKAWLPIPFVCSSILPWPQMLYSTSKPATPLQLIVC